MIDTGRIRMKVVNEILYCEAYMEDEFSLRDAHVILEEARNSFDHPADMILKKVSTYSVAVDVQLMMSRKIVELRNFIYVVDNEMKRASAEFAAESYMQPYNTCIVDSVNEAYEMLSTNH